MYLIGLTGGISSGKSTVSKILTREDCHVLDADEFSQRVVQPGSRAYKQIVAEFGSEFQLDSGQIDRAKLAELIFSDDVARRRLNAIVHPEIKKAMLLEIFLCFLKGYKFIVLEIPLLFETKFIASICSKIIVAYCDYETELQRLILRDNLSKTSAIARIESQMSLERKKYMATFVVDTSKTMEETEKQVLQIVGELKQLQPWMFRTVLAVTVALAGLLILRCSLTF